jgi:hypothetical protein
VVGLIFAGGCAVALATLAHAEKPVSVYGSGLHATFDAGFLPRAVSADAATPAAFGWAVRVRSEDGLHPPPLREIAIEVDRNVAIDVTAVPTCTPFREYGGNLFERCKGAVVGTGTAEVAIQFPEQAPIAGTRPRLLIFNGGVKDGVTTLYAAFRVAIPTPASVVSKIRIEKVDRGRFGSRAVVTLPKIAGGSGSVTDFSATIGDITRGDGAAGIVTLSCPVGRIRTHLEAIFESGVHIGAGLPRRCIPKRR